MKISHKDYFCYSRRKRFARDNLRKCKILPKICWWVSTYVYFLTKNLKCWYILINVLFLNSKMFLKVTYYPVLIKNLKCWYILIKHTFFKFQNVSKVYLLSHLIFNNFDKRWKFFLINTYLPWPSPFYNVKKSTNVLLFLGGIFGNKNTFRICS